MSKLRYFSIEDIMNLQEEYKPIVDKILYVGDLLLVKGRSKSGKSVFVQQLAHAVSCGETFLRVFGVPAALPVCYVSGEGFIGNWKERFINMQKLWPLNSSNMRFIECTELQLHRKEDGNKLYEKIKSIETEFKVFIFDNITYLCRGGNTNNPEHMGQFFGTVETIQREYNGTVVVVHHDSEKEWMTKDGQKVSAASPHTSMGHSSISAGITHSYTLSKFKRGGRIYQKLQVGNQRASWMVEELDMYMIVPEDDDEGRLGYVLDVDESSTRYGQLANYIRERKIVAAKGLYKNPDIDMPQSTLYFNLNKMLRGKIIKLVKKGKKEYYEWIGAEGGLGL